MWKCPACGGTEEGYALRVTATDAALNFVRPWVDRSRHDELVKCIRNLWMAEEARLVKCVRCGLRSADPFVGGNSRFYELAFGRGSLHPYPMSRWEFKLTQALISNTSGSVLEIGSGSGAFVRHLIAEGGDAARLHATEFNEEGQSILRSMGVTVEASDFRELAQADHSVLCGHQVFEHLGDLEQTFDAFDRLTAPTGIIALSVPNGRNILRTEAVGGQIDMPPNHVSTWVYGALDAVARRYGWRIIDYREEPISRLRATRELTKSRTFQARTQANSYASLVERWANSPRSRFVLTATAALVRLPSSAVASTQPHGGSLWVAMTRESQSQRFLM
jgi:hypothetical protein